MRRVAFIVFCNVFMFYVCGFSQNIHEDAETTIYSEALDTLRRVSFRPVDYFQPERYRPDYSEFSDKSFFDNMFLALYGGVDGVFKREGACMNAGARYGVSISKFFNPYSGLKLSSSIARSKVGKARIPFLSYNVSADYEFNISSYVSGFEPDKRFNVISTQGIGADFSFLDGKKEVSFDMHWGLKFRYNLVSMLNVFLEPRLLFYGDNYDFSEKENWRRYDLGYGALFGLEYAFGKRYHIYDLEKEFERNNGLFWAFSGGVQAPVTTITEELGVKSVLGPSLAVTVGKWILPSLGGKVTAFASANTYARTSNKYFLKQAAYGGIRIEPMFNLMGFFKNSRKWSFSVEPSIGLEAGLSFRQVSEHSGKGYAGLTTAIQFKYRLAKGLAFFVEPRYTYIPLNYEDGGIKDNLVALNFGVEAIRLFGNGLSSKTSLTSDFVPHFVFSSGIGGAMVVQQFHYINRALSHMANIGVGYWFNALSGIRIDGNYGTLITRMPENLVQVNLSSSVNYTLNIVNLMNGYDSQRRWNAEIFAGPLIGLVNQSPEIKMNFGLQGGGRLSFKVTDIFDFYAEPRFHLYARRLFPVNTGSPAIVGLNFGGAYHFGYGNKDKNIRKYAGKGFLDNTFVGFSMGGVNSWTNMVSGLQPDRFWNASGAEYSAYLGKWLTPYIGLKASLFGNFYSYLIAESVNDFDRITAYAGAGIELMFNPFRISFPERNWIFEIVPMAGVRAAELFQQMRKPEILRGEVSAFTVAMQFRWNVADDMALTLEPRWTRSPHNNIFPPVYGSRIREDLLSLSFGVEMKHTRDERHRKISVQREGYQKYWFATVGGGLNTKLSSRRYGKIRAGYGFEMYGGYSLTPVSAFRIGYDYCALPKLTVGSGKPLLHSNNLVLDYMFDISNLVMGFDSNRRAGVQLFVGPVFSLYGKENIVFRAGVEAGALGYVRILENFYFNVQPKARAFMVAHRGGRLIPRELLFDFTAGLTYRF